MLVHTQDVTIMEETNEIDCQELPEGGRSSQKNSGNTADKMYVES